MNSPSRRTPSAVTEYGANTFGVTEYGVTGHGVTEYGVTDRGVTDRGTTDSSSSAGVWAAPTHHAAPQESEHWSEDEEHLTPEASRFDRGAPPRQGDSGEPRSDRSTARADLLQSLGSFGAGRSYVGHPRFARTQRGAFILGLVLTVGCAGASFVTKQNAESLGDAGSFLLVLLFFGQKLGYFFLLSAVLSGVIDGITILCGKVTDGQGRPLRSSTSRHQP